MKKNKNNATTTAHQKAYKRPSIAVTRIGLECGFAIDSAPLNPTSEFGEITTEWEQEEDIIKTIEW